MKENCLFFFWFLFYNLSAFWDFYEFEGWLNGEGGKLKKLKENFSNFFLKKE